MPRRVVRAGVLGCGDLTHGKAWAELLAGPAGDEIGMRIVRVWDSDARACQELAERIGARTCARPEHAGEDVDGVLVTERYPEHYLDLARPFLRQGRRVFLNRPFAGSVAHALEVVRLAERHGASVYSASALMHTEAGEKAKAALPTLGDIRLFTATGPTEHLTWYLPHAIAAMVSVLGPDVEAVQALRLMRSPLNPHAAEGPVQVAVEYRTRAAGTAPRGILQMVGGGAKWYGFTLKLYGTEQDLPEVSFEVSYLPLLRNMAQFFATGVEPLSRETMLRTTSIHYASLLSATERGRRVRLAELLPST